MGFAVGDTVRAKIVSEGASPEMTVEWTDYSGGVGVVWFDVEQHLQRGRFNEAALEIAKKTKGTKDV